MTNMKMGSLRWRFLGLTAACLFVTAATVPAAPRRSSRDPWQQPDRVVADMNLKPGATIADIGAGRGYFTYRLARAVGEKGMVYATDISEKAVKAISDRIKKEGIKNIQVVISEATKTKLTPASLDAAMICMVLHHVPKNLRAPLTKDICRALKPGGYLYIVEWRVDAKVKHERDRRIPKADLIQLAKDAGMTLDAEFLYLPHQVYLRFRRPAKAK